MASTQHEPTMEEILASIRKIISEDSTEAPAAAPAAAAPAAPAPAAPEPVAAEPEVLELTQEIEEEPAPAPAPEPVRPAPVVEAKADDIVFETIEEAPVSEPVRSSDIFSDSTRKAMDDAFAGLDEEEDHRPSYNRGPIAPVDGAAVEAVFERAIRESFDPVLRQWLDANADAVVERMKPLIREWMDEHFPALLEGAVRNEVARVVQARGKKR